MPACVANCEIWLWRWLDFETFKWVHERVAKGHAHASASSVARKGLSRLTATGSAISQVSRGVEVVLTEVRRPAVTSVLCEEINADTTLGLTMTTSTSTKMKCAILTTYTIGNRLLIATGSQTTPERGDVVLGYLLQHPSSHASADGEA